MLLVPLNGLSSDARWQERRKLGVGMKTASSSILSALVGIMLRLDLYMAVGQNQWDPILVGR